MLERVLKLSQDISAPQRSTLRAGKDEIVVVPMGTCRGQFGELRSAMDRECLNREIAEHDCPTRASGLGSGDLRLLVPPLLERSGDTSRFSFEIYITPSQPEELPLAKPSAEREHK